MATNNGIKPNPLIAESLLDTTIKSSQSGLNPFNLNDANKYVFGLNDSSNALSISFFILFIGIVYIIFIYFVSFIYVPIQGLPNSETADTLKNEFNMFNSLIYNPKLSRQVLMDFAKQQHEIWKQQKPSNALPKGGSSKKEKFTGLDQLSSMDTDPDTPPNTTPSKSTRNLAVGVESTRVTNSEGLKNVNEVGFIEKIQNEIEKFSYNTYTKLQTFINRNILQIYLKNGSVHTTYPL